LHLKRNLPRSSFIYIYKKTVTALAITIFLGGDLVLIIFCGSLPHITVTQTISRDTTVMELSRGDTKLLSILALCIWAAEFLFVQIARILVLNPILHGVSVVGNRISVLTLLPLL